MDTDGSEEKIITNVQDASKDNSTTKESKEKIVLLRYSTVMQLDMVLREVYTWLDKDARFTRTNAKIRRIMESVVMVQRKMIHDPEELEAQIKKTTDEYINDSIRAVETSSDKREE